MNKDECTWTSMHERKCSRGTVGCSVDHARTDTKDALMQLANELRYAGDDPGPVREAYDRLEKAVDAAQARDVLEKIDTKAQAGLCYFTLESAREFLKDIREIANEALGREYKR